MTARKITQLNRVDQYILKKSESLLNQNRVAKFDCHGWLNADTPDPNFIGYAMAQSDSLSFRALEAKMGATPIQLEDWQKALIIAGGDLEGLMDSSRLCIGLMLLHERSFELVNVHFMSAMFLLGAASDRLRDFFIAAVFQRKPNSDSRRGKYVRPFDEAMSHQDVRRSEWVAASVQRLGPVAAEIAKRRDTRNMIVHDLATEEGRREFALVNDPPRPTINPNEWIAILRQGAPKFIDPEEESRKKLMSRTPEPIGWYRLMVKACNDAFLVENQLRHMRAKPE